MYDKQIRVVVGGDPQDSFDRGSQLLFLSLSLFVSTEVFVLLSACYVLFLGSRVCKHVHA